MKRNIQTIASHLGIQQKVNVRIIYLINMVAMVILRSLWKKSHNDQVIWYINLY
uniref:Uncharacterized protein n=1 Tax=Octopus bimaculoides TaxID=37653 RepID=A0A0L8IHR1_OCTBM